MLPALISECATFKTLIEIGSCPLHFVPSIASRFLMCPSA